MGLDQELRWKLDLEFIFLMVLEVAFLLVALLQVLPRGGPSSPIVAGSPGRVAPRLKICISVGGSTGSSPQDLLGRLQV